MVAGPETIPNLTWMLEFFSMLLSVDFPLILLEFGLKEMQTNIYPKYLEETPWAVWRLFLVSCLFLRHSELPWPAWTLFLCHGTPIGPLTCNAADQPPLVGQLRAISAHLLSPFRAHEAAETAVQFLLICWHRSVISKAFDPNLSPLQAHQCS